MATSKRIWRLLATGCHYRIIAPVLAGGIMLGASLFTWLLDPLGPRFSAWQLPIDIGWQIHNGMLNYGLLCLCCTLFCFFSAVQAWRQTGSYKEPRSDNPLRISRRYAGEQTRNGPHEQTMYRIAGLLCLIPSILFVLQYLYIDMGSIAQLARDETQAMLIKAHFGYGTAAQFIPIQIMTFDPLTINGRLALLFDQINMGFFLPCLSAALLLPIRKRVSNTTPRLPTRHNRWALPLLAGFALLMMVILGRGPAALLCDYQAEHLLATGNYTAALSWLDTASSLNPSLVQLSAYDIDRGQAWYYLHPDQPSTESRLYLAAFYRLQNDFPSSYQELQTIQQSGPTPLWVLDEMNTTLQRLAEQSHPLNGIPAQQLHVEEPSIKWVEQTLQIDPHNVYAHYMLGRLKYDLHDYAGSETQMQQVLDLSSNNDIQSSAYTYLALNSFGEKNYVTARVYLFKAQDLDIDYHNNIAREEISGLR